MIKRIINSSKVNQIETYFRNLFINGIAMSYLIPISMRRVILNLWGCQIKGAVHGHTTLLSNKLSLGRHSFINRNCIIGNGHEFVRIGSNCAIAYGVTIATDNHYTDNKIRRGGGIKSSPVEIQDGCWIGCNVTILPGTIIEKGCVVAAGSIVKGVLQENGFYAGVPAKLIKQLPV